MRLGRRTIALVVLPKHQHALKVWKCFTSRLKTESESLHLT
jgi:hypothetical protein